VTQVTLLEKDPHTAAWDALIEQAPGATAFHTSAWARLWTRHWPKARWETITVTGAAGYDAGLGFIVLEGPLGPRIFAMPYGTYGGPLVRNGHPDPAAIRRGLLEAYARRIHAAGIRSSHLQWYEGRREDLPPGLSVGTGVTHVRALQPDFDALLATLPHSVRSRVQQAQRNGLAVTPVTDTRGVRAYHALAVKTITRHGGVPKPEALYLRIFEGLVPRGLARFDLVEHEGRAIAGSLHLIFRDTAFNWLTIADEEHRRLRPNHLVIARVMRDLGRSGVREYNFGGSPPGADGLVAFKESWGASPRPVLDVTRRSLLDRLLRR
jgi:hypothetical protein